MKRNVIIGLGTGRCGTLSLSKFLNAQKSVMAVHEGNLPDRNKPYQRENVLPWEKNEAALNDHFRQYETWLSDEAFFSDTGSYFLSYVETILRMYPHAKFICFERPRGEVVESFLKKTEGRNHWKKHDGIRWRKDPFWDQIFPKYDLEKKSWAIEKYWDEYHAMSRYFEKTYPKNFQIFDFRALNSKQGRKEILDFAGIPEKKQSLEGDLHFNKTPSKIHGIFEKYFRLK